MEIKRKGALAITDYEATMKVKVTKPDGSSYEIEGHDVVAEIDEGTEALIKEYKAITKRAKEIELILLSKLIGE